MRTTSAPARTTHDGRARRVVDTLLGHGLLAAEQQDLAVSLVEQALGHDTAAAPLRRRLAEIAGYVGGALVVSAAVIFFATQWPSLSAGTRIGLLAAVALVLAVAGVAIGMAGTGLAALRRDEEPAQRRLVSVLLVGAAASATFAVGLLGEELVEGYSELPPVLSFTTLTALTLVAYLTMPSALAQIVLAVSVVPLAVSVVEYASELQAAMVGGLLMLAGALWLVVAERGGWREPTVGRVAGAALLVGGAQGLVFETGWSWVGYLALLLVALGGFVAYTVVRAWPYLAAAVAGLTLAVPEALMDWTDNAVGPAGVLLAAGLTLLVASLLGLRLRHEVAAPH